MKIKSVSIQAFKSYMLKKDGFFDFTIHSPGTTENIARLVSIYAPNGFGKTSFYDAVDFAITNNVNRYLNYNKAKSNAKLGIESGAKYILRNNKADEYEVVNGISLPTELIVSTTKGDFKKNVKKPKGNQKIDYLSNKSKPSNEVDNNTSYMQRIMLSQEAIDSFLREIDPQQRFDEFIKNSETQLSSYFEKREIIKKFYNFLMSEIKKINQDFSDKKDQLKLISQVEYPFGLINSVVEKINSINLGAVSKLINPFEKNDKEALENELLVIESRIQGSLLEIDSFISSWGLLSQNKEIVLLVVTELEKISNDIKGIEENIEKIHKKDDLNDTLQAEIKKEKSEIANVQKKMEWWGIVPEFIEYNLGKSAINKKIELINKKIAAKQSFYSYFEKELVENSKNIDSINEYISSQKRTLDQLPIIYEKIDLFSKDKERLLIEKNGHNELLEKYRKKYLMIELGLDSISKLSIGGSIDVESFENTMSFYYIDTLRHCCYEFNSLTKELERIRSEKASLDEWSQRLNNQSSVIKRLVQTASIIISESKTSTCPVCQHQHDSFAKLQQIVTSHDVLNSNQQSLIEQRNKLEEKDQQVSKEIASYKNKFDKMTVNIKEGKKDELKSLAQKIKDIENKSILNEKLFHDNESNLKKLIDVTESKTQSDLNKVCLDKIDKAYLNLKSAEKRKLEVEEQLSETNSEIDGFKTALEIELKEMSNIKSGEAKYEKINYYLQEKEVDENVSIDYLYNLISDDIRKHNFNLDEILLHKETLVEQINEANLEIFESGLLSLDSCQASLLEKKNNYRFTFGKLDDYSDLFDALNKPKPVSIRQLEAVFKEGVGKYNESINERDYFRSCLVDCSLLRELSERALNYSKRISIESEMKKIEEKLTNLRYVEAELTSDLKKINSFIQSLANDFFKTNLINQIYSAIDPHPEFKEVRFECKLSGTDKGELNIFAYDPDRKEQIPPVLSFSAAQINVLSLSVFLARALTTVDKNGDSVNCIFVDDPIQSLDSINILSFIDLLRNLVVRFDKQIIISTHDENFHELMKKKIPGEIFKSKFIRLESFGKVVEDNM